MQVINTQRVQSELKVLRAMIALLTGIVATSNGKGKPATYFPNTNNPVLTAFTLAHVSLEKVAALLSGLYEELASTQIGVMLDTVVIKPGAITYKSADDERLNSLKKKVFINLSLSTWTRENIGRLTVAAAPNDKFYNVDLLSPILDQLEADIEVVKFEQDCEGYDAPAPSRYSQPPRKPQPRLRAPLIRVEEAFKVLEQFSIGGSAAQALCAELNSVSKTEEC